MKRFYEYMDEAIYNLRVMVNENKEVNEFLGEEYGSLLEDDMELCLIDFLVRYYNKTDDIIDMNS